MFLFPGFENVRRSKCRNHRAHFLPNCGLCPNEPGAAGSKHPFVRAGGKRVAAQGRDFRIFHSQPVHSVNDQQHTILFFAAAVRFGNALRDTRDREPHAAA